MRLAYTLDEQRFRDEVRDFLAANLPPELAAAEAASGHLRRAEYAGWHRTLARQGWAAPGWPEECGGAGWSPAQRHIFEVEYGRSNAPEISIIGIGLVGPVLCAFGSAAMKARYLPAILSGELYFCQGFSEPGAGSDLARLTTRAERDGDDWLITGQKTWTSHAADADVMICLARTDASVKPQAGLSMLLVPMDAPGLTVRQIESIDGMHSVYEVFLDEVRVPASALVGEENRAWTYAKFLLTNERTHNAYIGILRRYQDRLRRTTAPSDDFARARAVLEIDIEALDWSVLRVLSGADEVPDASASALKVTGSALLMRAAELELTALGPAGIVDVHDGDLPRWSSVAARGARRQALYWRASSVFGGANEIQRTLIWNALAR